MFMALAMIMTSIIVPTTAFAATKNLVVGAVPNIADTGNYTLASIRIEEDVKGNFAVGDVVVLTLPSGVEFNGVPTATLAQEDGGVTTLTATPAIAAANVCNVTIGGVLEATEEVVITITVPVAVTSVGTGAINLNVAAPGTGIASGDYTVGNFVTGAGAVSALSAPTRGGSSTFGTVRIIENAIGAFGLGETVTLKLPSGYTWGAPALTDTTDLVFGAAVLSDGDRTATFAVTTAGTTGQSIIDITTPVVVGSNAKKGDIKVTLGGTADVTGEVVIGSYADYTVDVTGATAKAAVSAKDDQKIANVTVEELIPGSILPGRTITFTLPTNTRFSAAPTLQLVSGNNIWATAAGVLSDSDTKATFTMTTTASTTAAELRLNNVDVDIAANFSGDINMAVAGTAGAEGTIKVAEVAPIVKLESDAKEIKIGTQEQAIGDIVITEGVKEALASGTKYVNIVAPAGVTFSKVPTAEVVTGDLEIKSVTKPADNTISIEIDAQSSVASSIKVSNLFVTANRSVPEGNVEFTVAGTAVMQNAVAFTNVTDAGSVVAAKVVTPAPTETKNQNVVFTIDQKSYTVDGVTVEADVAPFIKDNRTMVPVRFIATATGVPESNIIWDGIGRTVTILGTNKTVQLTIGSKTMLVNGTPVTMDTAAIISQDRTYVPIAWIAMALDVEYTWDAAARTVTFK